MASADLKEIHDTLVSIANDAGKMIMAAHPSTLSHGTKKNTADIVTETDQAVEKMVSTTLSSKYPTYSFIGEETYHPGLRLTSAPTFICDPIDGTTNFVHAFPSVCISLGFVVDKKPAVGVIFNPFTDTLYTAIAGQGAYMTQSSGAPQKLPLKHPEPLKDLSTCLIGAEWGSDRSGMNFELKAKVFRKLAAAKEEGGSMVHSLRCLGSAALNLCAVAAGFQDVFWEGGCWVWDVAAGACILFEAGGIIVDGNPGGWEPDLDCRRYLAVRGAPSGQKEVVNELWEVIGDGRLDYHA